MTSLDTKQWVEPIQERSRKKVERILDAALELAVEAGSLQIKMTDVAKTAGVAVGTLYQFFPTRSALIGKLFAREMEPIDQSIPALFAEPFSMSNMVERIETIMLKQYDLLRTRPGLALIWSAPTIDPAIEAADYENTRQNAETLAAQMRPLTAGAVTNAALETTALLICHLWGSVIRLCVLSEGAAPHIIRQYARMIAHHGERLTA